MRLLPRRRLLKYGHNTIPRAVHITLRGRRHGAQQALPRLAREVQLLKEPLRRVDVRQVECRARVTRVEDGRQAHAGGQGLHHYAVHLVVGYVAGLPEVDGVDDFVVAVRLVGVDLSCAPSVAYVGRLAGCLCCQGCWGPRNKPE